MRGSRSSTRRAGRGYQIEDLGSRNGTFVNGETGALAGVAA